MVTFITFRTQIGRIQLKGISLIIRRLLRRIGCLGMVRSKMPYLPAPKETAEKDARKTPAAETESAA